MKRLIILLALLFATSAWGFPPTPPAKPLTDILTTTITDGDLTHSPDGNSVFDANALKANAASPAFTGQVNLVKGADFTGATVDLATATGNVLDITTDTTALSTFGTRAAGAIFYLRFTSARDLTYNVTSMILPGSRTITTTAGDTAIFESLGSGNWLCLMYRKADGRLLGDLQVVTVSSTRDLTVNEMTGQTILVTGAYTPSMPAAIVGRKGKFVATTATAFSADVKVGTDVIYLNQTAQAAGEKITSDGTIRATVYCECAVAGVYDCTVSRGLFINGGS